MNKIIVVSCFVVMVLSGCKVLDQVFEPNTVATTTHVITAAGQVATVAGQPWGWMLTTGAGLIGVIAASYNNWRNKTKAANQYDAIAATTKSIVDAIEATGSIPTTNGQTVGDLVKTEVAKNLTTKEIFDIGKAIISGLKG